MSVYTDMPGKPKADCEHTTRGSPHVHGTMSAYTNCGCRCDQCRGAGRRYMGARRQRLGGSISRELWLEIMRAGLWNALQEARAKYGKVPLNV